MSKQDVNALNLLDRPIAYHRVFVTLTGSVKAAVLLSQAVYWQKRAKQTDGWWYKTAEDWEDETGLSKRELQTARKDCNKYLKTELRGMPATLFWKVDEDALSQDLLSLNDETSCAENAQQVMLKTHNKLCLKRTTSFDKSAQLVLTKAHNINTETTSEINAEINTKTKQETTTQESSGGKNIFEIYESNIGVLTPMIADELRLIEKEFPAGWFEKAVKVAVNANKRKLSYVRGILRRWQEDGLPDDNPVQKKQKNIDVFLGSRYEQKQ